MSFLLDTDICSAHLKGRRKLFSRFQQYAGRLHISRIVLAELYAWAHLSSNPAKRLDDIEDLVGGFYAVEFDNDCAMEFGRLRVQLRRKGLTIGAMDLLIAATALVHDLTLVTNNLSDFESIPGLRVINWLKK
ncbi:MAG: type II toxin-antitoxin system VapC family toxin [Planctomycetia bacterium]|nr:type II toxin-antitoxin system VapC family toxin [Planctomycetia bacterium]